MKFNLYGLLIACGVLLAVVYMSQESKRLKLPQETALDMALWAMPPAIVFARLYYVVFSWQNYRDNPISILYLWEGGLAIYGGILGGALGVYLLSRRRRLPMAVLSDLVAPGLLLGQALGRWGNFFNGEAYGKAITNPALQFFPIAVQVRGQWHMAAFFYESLWNATGVLFLLKLRNAMYKKGAGFVFAWYLIWYGLGRMVIEGFREDSLWLGSLRVSQWLSVVLVAAAGLGLLWKLRLKPFLLLPLAAGLGLLLSAALGQTWALVPGYILMFLFSALLLSAFLSSRPQGGKE